MIISLAERKRFISDPTSWYHLIGPLIATCYVTLVNDRHFPIWSCFPTMWTITLIFPRSDTQYHVLVQWLDYCQMSLKNNQMLSEHCQKLPNVWAVQNTTKKRKHAAFNRSEESTITNGMQIRGIFQHENTLSFKRTEITTHYCLRCVYFTDKGFISNVKFLIIKLFWSLKELLCHQKSANQSFPIIIMMTPED